MARIAQKLAGRVALVAGGTRGAGRGIAVELGAAGAVVYVTGRTTNESASPMGRRETIEGTAHLVNAAAGTGLAVRVDHSRADEVRALFERIEDDYGRLDVWANDVWGGDSLTQWDSPFWEQGLGDGLALLHNAVDTHIITSWHAGPLVVRTPGSLIVEVTDGVSSRYQGSLLVPLVADPAKLERTGTVTATWQLAKDYGFTDVDGSRPDWGQHAADAPGWST